MTKKDARVNEYISKSGGFAQPLLNHLRDLVHKTLPEVEEEKAIEWMIEGKSRNWKIS